MRIDWENTNIYLKPGATDMRKQSSTLAVAVEREMRRDVLSGNLFVFCGRNRKSIKVLYWEKNGFCMWQKRLEKDRFPWPADETEARQISTDQLFMLLRGIDFFKEHKPVFYTAVS